MLNRKLDLTCFFRLAGASSVLFGYFRIIVTPVAFCACVFPAVRCLRSARRPAAWIAAIAALLLAGPLVFVSPPDLSAFMVMTSWH